MKFKRTQNNLQPQSPPKRRGATAPQPFERALGTNAKSFDKKNTVFEATKGLEPNCSGSFLPFIDESTGEITNFTKNNKNNLVEAIDHDKLITERYMLLSSVRSLMPLSRQAKCHRLTRGCDISVLKNTEFNSVKFSGVQTCGSVWSCPICAAKISERRKIEVVSAIEQHLQNQGHLYFLTLTFRHTKEQSLAENLKKQAKALKYFRDSRPYKDIYKKHIGYLGLIRAKEVTWGMSNGWHPHTHEIIFAQNKKSFQSIKRILFPAWSKACVKAGLLPPSYARGLDIRGGDKAGDYVNKFGSELTKTHFKKAKGDRYSPFDLLRSYFYEDNKLHGAKFVEFAEHFQGSRQLYWTNGLKAKFYINDKNDQELAEEHQEPHTHIADIKLNQWRAIVKYKSQATVNIMFKTHKPDVVFNYIDSLYQRYLTTGDKQKDDLKIKKQREFYRKASPKTEYKDFLTIDNTCIFDRINYQIDLKNRTDLHALPLALSIKNDIFYHDKQQQFFKKNYIEKPKNDTQ